MMPRSKYCELVAGFAHRAPALKLCNDLNDLGIFRCKVWSSLNAKNNQVLTTRYAHSEAVEAMDFLTWNPTPEEIAAYVGERMTPDGKLIPPYSRAIGRA